MAKRQADSYLTDRNWDAEEEAQEVSKISFLKPVPLSV